MTLAPNDHDQDDAEHYDHDDKLSDRLGDFLAPYSHLAADEVSYRNLLRIAIAAWNLALFPADRHPALLDEMVSPERLAVDEAARAEMRALLGELVARKGLLFAAERRYIVDFDLKSTPDGYELSVASTLPKDAA